MSNIFLISDTHYGHRAATEQFTREDGSKLRDFNSVEECDEFQVEQWNRVVRPSDKVYHLGDVVMPKNHRSLQILSRLNGQKVLIKGNHDELKPSKYLEYFKDIRGSHMLDRLVLTHIPLHPASLLRWRGNIHGHLHSYAVLKAAYMDGGTIMYQDGHEDPKYYCVSVERINYQPIPFETVNQIFKDRGF